jgi:predicted N-formylglutamate amidohydrolase
MVGRLKSVGAGDFFGETDPKPVTVLNPHSAGPFAFTCDHACNRIPVRLGDMGMTREQLEAHIAWDPGALGVALELASRFNSPLVYGSYSRLVVDLNRPPESPGSMPLASAGIAVPGNAEIDESERRLRLDALFHPYHSAIDRVLSERAAASRPTALVAVHSFTPDFPGEKRPWHVGVIHRRDFGLGAALVDALREPNDVVVGDNLPFQIQDDGDVTIPRHGERRRLPNVLIEVRQDTLTTAPAREIWAARLYAALERALGTLSSRA